MTKSTPNLAAGVRTLLASGYQVTRTNRHPNYAEVICEKIVTFGVTIKLLVAFTENDLYTSEEIEDLQRSAHAQSRELVLVAQRSVGAQLSWEEFCDELGGVVPTWRVLSSEYGQFLLTASENRLPAGLTGEAWLLFEDLVGDGIGFLFGRKVVRLGGRKRGRAVSDLSAVLPDLGIVVTDAKATKGKFDASASNLRALGEYVKRQVLRQQGQTAVYCALVISANFEQTEIDLLRLSSQFLAEYDKPVAFLKAETLLTMVDTIKHYPTYRNAIRWRNLFAGGEVTKENFEKELKQALDERIEH